jgi:hypothetical protein
MSHCQVPGCPLAAATVVEVDLPATWEPTANFTALTVHVALCETHSFEVTQRVQALLEARADIPNLLRIIEAVVDAGMQRQPAGVA